MNPKSFYQCDTCHYKYKFGTGARDKLFISRLLGSSIMIYFISVIILFVIIFMAGFIGKVFDPSIEWDSLLYCFNLKHFCTGAIYTGMSSIIAFLINVVGGGAFRYINTFHSLFRETDKDSCLTKFILIIIILIGLLIVLVWIFEVVESWTKRMSKQIQLVVLSYE